jgi:hypothetical protein
MRCTGHSLKIFTTTIKQAGEKRATGQCTCGWYTDTVYAREVREQYRNHIKDALQKQKAGV